MKSEAQAQTVDISRVRFAARVIRLLGGVAGFTILIVATLVSLVVRPALLYAQVTRPPSICGTGDAGVFCLLAEFIVLAGSWAGTSICRHFMFLPRTSRLLLVATFAAYLTGFLFLAVIAIVCYA